MSEHEKRARALSSLRAVRINDSLNDVPYEHYVYGIGGGRYDVYLVDRRGVAFLTTTPGTW